MVTRATIVTASGRGVAERWRSQYQHDGRWTRTVSGDSGAVYEKLCDLGPNPDIDAVAEVIGNKSWSYLTCNGCGEYVRRAANLTREYASDDNLICEECLRDGLGALNQARAA